MSSQKDQVVTKKKSKQLWCVTGIICQNNNCLVTLNSKHLYVWNRKSWTKALNNSLIGTCAFCCYAAQKWDLFPWNKHTSSFSFAMGTKKASVLWGFLSIVKFRILNNTFLCRRSEQEFFHDFLEGVLDPPDVLLVVFHQGIFDTETDRIAMLPLY